MLLVHRRFPHPLTMLSLLTLGALVCHGVARWLGWSHADLARDGWLLVVPSAAPASALLGQLTPGAIDWAALAAVAPAAARTALDEALAGAVYACMRAEAHQGPVLVAQAAGDAAFAGRHADALLEAMADPAPGDATERPARKGWPWLTPAVPLALACALRWR